MKRMIIALLATSALAAPALAQNASPPTQKPQPQQEHSQRQSMAKPQHAQKNQQQAANQQQPGKQVANQQPISPQSLNRGKVRQLQTALNKDGFPVGRVDGIWGTRTREAVQKFQESKGMPGNGALNQNTLAALGVQLNTQQSSG